MKTGDERDAFARRLGHPFDLGLALIRGVTVFDHLGEPDEILKCAEEADRVGRDSSLPFLTECLAPVASGIAFIRKGRVAEGIALLERGLAVWQGAADSFNFPTINRF